MWHRSVWFWYRSGIGMDGGGKILEGGVIGVT